LEPLYLFVFTHCPSQNRYALLLEMLYQKQSDWVGTSKQNCARRPDHSILMQDFYLLIIVLNG